MQRQPPAREPPRDQGTPPAREPPRDQGTPPLTTREHYVAIVEECLEVSKGLASIVCQDVVEFIEELLGLELPARVLERCNDVQARRLALLCEALSVLMEERLRRSRQ